MSEEAKRIANVIDMHQLRAPEGGTASQAICECSCGFKAVVPGGLRMWAKRDAQQHIAEQIIHAMEANR